MEKLISELANEWKTAPALGFAQRAHDRLAAYRPAKNRAGAVDPKRLNGLAKALSQLKARCLESDGYNPKFEDDVDVVQAEHGKLPQEWHDAKDLVAIVALQKQWKYESDELKKALSQVRAVPDELKALKLTATERDENQTIQRRQAKKKLDKSVNVDLNQMLKDVAPGLSKDSFNDVVVALLLTTGRRTVEIMKTGRFTYVDEYKVHFDGQAKKAGGAGEGYDIDLLAPAELVMKALEWVRQNCDTTTLSPVLTNSKYGKKINTAVVVKCKVKPHDLRGINAVGCFKLWGKGKSLIGYMQSHLGHDGAESTTRYQTFEVKVTRPWSPDAADAPEPEPEGKEEKKEEKLPFGMEGWSVPSRNKIKQIAKMMEEGMKINATNVRTTMKGSPALISKVLAYGPNADIIKKYNDARVKR